MAAESIKKRRFKLCKTCTIPPGDVLQVEWLWPLPMITEYASHERPGVQPGSISHFSNGKDTGDRSKTWEIILNAAFVQTNIGILLACTKRNPCLPTMIKSAKGSSNLECFIIIKGRVLTNSGVTD